ncbi:MAG: phosphoribosyl-AMP cyclohydrolase [Alphaproteobacteria bacterium]|nr:phosphoribosyl-AMP cyclohydrolase [Alphaproteobacteria bacterium]
MENNQKIEETLDFLPKFDENGLIPCITTSVKTGKPLMFAYMNAQSLQKSIETGEAYYWSRSRNQLWHKGASSGLTQKIIEMRTDCDQDCLWISVETGTPDHVQGREASCHTGRESCFYRKINIGQDPKTVKMQRIDDEIIFDPECVYGS